MGIILLKMPQWLISVFNWFTLSSMKKIIITQMLIAIIITMFDKACEIILKGPCVWDIQDVVAFIILDTVLIIKQMNYFFIVLSIITTHLLQQGLLENIYNKI